MEPAAGNDNRNVVGDGGGDLPRRTRILMYLAMVLVLAAYWSDESPPPARKQPPRPKMQLVGSQKQLRHELASAGVANAELHYPQNVSETFMGVWARTPQTWPLPQRGNISLDFITTGKDDASKLHFANPAGRLSLRLLDVNEPIDGIQVVRGALRIVDGIKPTDHDLVTIVEGVYLPAVGRLAVADKFGGSTVGVMMGNSKARRLDAHVDAQPVGDVSGDHEASHGMTLSESLQVQAGLHVDPDDETRDALQSAMAEARRQLGELSSTNFYGDGPPPAGLKSPRCGVRAVLNMWPMMEIGPGQVSLDDDPPPVTTGSDRRLSPGEALPPMRGGRRLGAAAAARGTGLQSPLLLRTNGMVYSTNCSFVMNVTMHAYAIDKEILGEKTMHFAAVTTIVAICQMGAVIYQLSMSANQSRATRTSMLSVGAQAILDSYTCLLLLVAGMFWDPFFNSFAIASFAKLVLFSIMEMRLLLVLWNARRPQAFAAGWPTLRRELTKMYARFYCSLLAGMVLAYVFWSSLYLLVFAAYSFWIPQIVHNAQHGTRTGLTPQYVSIMSVTRLFVPLYLWACPANFLRSIMPYTLSYQRAMWLVVWVGVQVAVMQLQSRWHPQFFIPGFCLPPKYNYHRPVSEALRRGEHVAPMPVAGNAGAGGDEGAGAGAGAGGPQPPLRGPQWLGPRVRAGLASSATWLRQFRGRVEDWYQQRRQYQRVDTDHRDDADAAVDIEMGRAGRATGADTDSDDDDGIDCVICTCNVALVGREYMLTPCNHIFHTECLTRWMEVKMECPVCRGPLPAV